MRLMYPHPVDRYRLIERLVLMERKRFNDGPITQQGTGQSALAERAGVSQATVSNLENLANFVGSSKRRVSRQELIKILVCGLGLKNQAQIDALLWLYDGQPLSSEEIGAYARSYLSQACPEEYRHGELRAVVLNWVQEVIQHYNMGNAGKAQPTRVITIEDEKANLTAVHELHEMERVPGQRMLLMRYPSFVTLSSHIHPSESPDAGNGLEGIREDFRSLTETRLQNLALYGERSIHHRGSIEAFIENGPANLSLEERHSQIRRWIELLSRYPDYEVRFTDTAPALEVNLKTAGPVILGAGVNEQLPWQTSGWKAQWLKLNDEAARLFFLLAFEREWDKLNDQNRSYTLGFLRRLLEESCL